MAVNSFLLFPLLGRAYFLLVESELILVTYLTNRMG